MSKITFDLEDEQVDSIIVQQLAWHRDVFVEDIAACEKGEGMAIFDTNRKKDLTSSDYNGKEFISFDFASSAEKTLLAKFVSHNFNCVNS